MRYRLLVTFTNHSAMVRHFDFLVEAYGAACRNISYGSGTVSRVEILMPEGTIRAIWDASWSPESQAAGLSFPV